MGEFKWEPEPALERLAARVQSGVELTATEVMRLAILRAPVRKAFKGGRPSKVELHSFVQKLGGGSSFSGEDIRHAAADLGINLNESEAKSIAAGRGSLRVQTTRNQRANSYGFRGKRERYATRLNPSGSGLRLGAVFGHHYQRATGRSLRTVRPITNLAGQPTGRVTIDTARLNRQGVALSARAKRDIESARIGRGTTIAQRRGVVRIGGQHQYGGYLRSHIKIVRVTKGTVVRIRVVSGAPYSRYVEFPTSRTAAQPFLLPALKSQRTKYAGNLKRQFEG